MTISAARLLVVYPDTKDAELLWPTAQPSDNLDYALDLSLVLATVGDTIAAVSVDIAPSGTGELQALDLSVDGYVSSVQLTGGVPGRPYDVRHTITGISGRVWQYLVQLRVSAQSGLIPSPAAPSEGYSAPPITWNSGATVFGPAITSVATGLIGTGTNQATAQLLLAQTNIASSVPDGTGFILNGALVSGTLVFQNDDPTNNALLYPPVGAQINDLGVNVPFVVGFQGARISFSTQNAATQWYAG